MSLTLEFSHQCQDHGGTISLCSKIQTVKSSPVFQHVSSLGVFVAWWSERWNGIPRTRVRVPVEMHVFHISIIVLVPWSSCLGGYLSVPDDYPLVLGCEEHVSSLGVFVAWW